MFKHRIATIKSFFRHGFQFRNMRYWDGSYLFQGLSILLSNYIQEFESIQEGAYVGIERDIKKMRVCRALCDRILHDAYRSPYEEKSQKQLDYWWASATITDLPDGGVSYSFPDKKRGFNYIKAHTEFRQDMKKQDQSLLFNILNKNIQRWWW